MTRSVSLMGAVLILAYTCLISGADAITKLIAGGYAAPQLFFFSGAIVVALSVTADRVQTGQFGRNLRTSCPKVMALRSLLTVAACAAFFYAFKLLPFAEVFIFIGLMPIFAGLLSGPILREKVSLPAWFALISGFVGVLCLFPDGIGMMQVGHLWALAAVLCGTLSMVLARYISKHESNLLAQVFYPNLAICLCMGAVLPWVIKPMPMADFGWVVSYAVLLFAARWILVAALKMLAAYVATPLMNLQFVWMTVMGALFFGEFPGANVYIGAAVVIASGTYLVYDQLMPEMSLRLRPWRRARA